MFLSYLHMHFCTQGDYYYYYHYYRYFMYERGKQNACRLTQVFNVMALGHDYDLELYPKSEALQWYRVQG